MANRSATPCPVCYQPMTRYVDGWRCMNVKDPYHTGSLGVEGQRPGTNRKGGRPYPKGIHVDADRCPWKIRWTFDTDTQCGKAAHTESGDYTHKAGTRPGQTIIWRTGDAREFTGDWPGGKT